MIISGPIEHRVFGTLLGVWIGFLFSDPFPDPSLWGGIFVVYGLFTIAVIAILLRISFTRSQVGVRLFAYFVLLIVAVGFIVPGVYLFTLLTKEFGGQLEISLWELVFLPLILFFWCTVAEVGEITQRARIVFG